MKTRAISIIAGHFVAIAIGMAMARTWHHQEAESIDKDLSASSGSSISASQPRSTRISRTARPGATPLDSAQMKAAWQEMQHLPLVDRQRLRPKLLAEWAAIDLHAALDAALMEPDRENVWRAFDDLFQKSPDAFKEYMIGEQFGLKSAELRNWWIDQMTNSDPDALLAGIADFNESDRKKIVERCAATFGDDPDRLWAMAGDFAKLPDTPENRKLWSHTAAAIAARLDADTVIAKLSAIPGAAGDVMISQAMTAMLAKTDYAGARATYASLPADLKPQIVQAALRAPGSNVQAYFAALDEVINTPQWESLQQPLAVKLHGMSPAPDQYPAMLDWAAHMPERDDTMDLYRVAVRKFVTYQPDQARDWISEMPGGWKQQNSLAAFVQAALFGRGDVRGADWALPQITDPKFRTEADGWFETYAQKNPAK